MGILDFTEICSANPSHKSVKHSKPGLSRCPSDFELFAQEFFSEVKGFEIFRTVSVGPDLGIDIGVEQRTEHGSIRWLVSCKHYAHSNGNIPVKHEYGIVEKVKSWQCDGFIPFYTGVPTSSLSQLIDGAEGFIKVERYYKDRIERELLTDPAGSVIAARYFPKSLANHYRKIISPVEKYTERDVILENNAANLLGMSSYYGDDTSQIPHSVSRLVKYANIMAGFQKHKPYFDIAMNDAVALFPAMFNVIDASKNTFEPTWDLMSLIEQDRVAALSDAYFVCSVWSFWNCRTANILFADFMVLREERDINSADEFEQFRKSPQYKAAHYAILKRGLLTPGCIGILLQDDKRDILARLLAFANSMK